MSVVRLAEQIRRGAVSPLEAVESCLAQIDRLDGSVNSFISVLGDEARAQAAKPVAGPLSGVPLAVKDIIDVRGARTTAASAILADNVASRDATAVTRLRQAGAVIVGKLNTHEFAWGTTSTSPHFGPVHNPWSLDRIAGGSSGGSGAAVAARLVPGALGTDTGGSIRIPSALCGVTGLRPTFGLVPSDGVVPVARTFDVVGPIAQSAEDCALLLDVMAGTRTDVRGGVAGTRIGVVSQLIEQAGDDVAVAIGDAIATLRSLGALLEDVSIPMLPKAGIVQELIMLPEASEVHRTWLRTRLAEYGDDVRARLLAGVFLPATAYVTALRAREAYLAELDELFAHVDVVIAPTLPIVAPEIGEETVELRGERVPYRLAVVPFSSPWSLGGLPVLSVPCGSVDGLPVGAAIVGRPGAEQTILSIGHAFQQETAWHEREPTDLARRETR